MDDVKTEYSRDAVSLDARLSEVLLRLRSASIFPRDEDWLFANPVTGRPYHQESLQESQIKRAAKLAGLGGDIGDLPKAANYCKLLIYLVARAGFEPASFGLWVQLKNAKSH